MITTVKIVHSGVELQSFSSICHRCSTAPVPPATHIPALRNVLSRSSGSVQACNQEVTLTASPFSLFQFTMSWDAYVDYVIAKSEGSVSQAVLIGLNGAIWTPASGVSTFYSFIPVTRPV